eukprot:TRINITY_DN15113_c0_g1_i1.p1 TRINITY_DN15113_c0_g1~~TRINITY_DN15113_c0_g1_i1.p1  ORF type:complete len:412 (-),score=138.47 TRINITY_DN15113_c0_g1_i1:55-1266(-)
MGKKVKATEETVDSTKKKLKSPAPFDKKSEPAKLKKSAKLDEQEASPPKIKKMKKGVKTQEKEIEKVKKAPVDKENSVKKTYKEDKENKTKKIKAAAKVDKAKKVESAEKVAKKEKKGENEVQIKKAKKKASLEEKKTKKVKVLKEKKGKKQAKKEEEDEEEEEELEGEIPSVETDSKLKDIAEASLAAENSAQQDESDDNEEEDADSSTTKVAEKVKVRRKDALIKKKEKKSFISLENPTEDNKVQKVRKFGKRGVVYIGHIPHGFFEKQIREFFSQFGTVTNLRLARSKKTGKSRGFAYVQFKFLTVAQIVAETMNNYLMFDKIMKVRVIPEERVSHRIFAGKVDPNKPPGLVARRKEKAKMNSEDKEAKKDIRVARRKQKVTKMNKALKDLGINYSVAAS